ncbi:MAG: hypothetical protein CL681_25070 [Blastopirellula sp.]|nr:hypothetical protein [Blastopirellula sp.]MAR13228.1 hypothetical protein [Blastopirellula sp.]
METLTQASGPDTVLLVDNYAIHDRLTNDTLGCMLGLRQGLRNRQTAGEMAAGEGQAAVGRVR